MMTMDDRELDQIAGFVKAKVEELRQEMYQQLAALVDQVGSNFEAQGVAIDQLGAYVVEKLNPGSYRQWLMDSMVAEGIGMGDFAEHMRKYRVREEQAEVRVEQADAEGDGDADQPG
jgi:hypothetical protein